jgi:peptide/nickel transport system permease protein
MRRLRNPALALGVAAVGTLVVLAAAAGVVRPGDPMAMVGPRGVWPLASPAYPLGTDQLGRDVTAQLLYGARVSLTVGIGAAAVATMIGVGVGVCAGYFGGIADAVLSRVCEYFQTLPTFLLSMVLVAVLTPSIGSIMLAIGLTAWPEIARLTRAEALRIRNADWVLAARTMGRSDRALILEHVLPNGLAPVVAMIAAVVAHAVLVEAALAFLGLGDPNLVSWGGMIGNARPLLRTLWYLMALPGVAIFLTVTSFTLLGNGLAERLDPRGSGR